MHAAPSGRCAPARAGCRRRLLCLRDLQPGRGTSDWSVKWHRRVPCCPSQKLTCPLLSPETIVPSGRTATAQTQTSDSLSSAASAHSASDKHSMQTGTSLAVAAGADDALEQPGRTQLDAEDLLSRCSVPHMHSALGRPRPQACCLRGARPGTARVPAPADPCARTADPPKLTRCRSVRTHRPDLQPACWLLWHN